MTTINFNREEWTVKIQCPVERYGYDFYLFRQVGDKTEFLVNGGQKTIAVDLYESPKEDVTFLKISGFQAKEIMKSLAEALCENGIKTPNEFKIAGLLEATKNHLNDLRHLLKLPKNND